MDGILLVDKPRGFTSHDVVDLIRKRFGLKKVGHAGTLDPMATGLLIILIGGYTKRSNEFLNHDKGYDATMTLGATSDTADAWGRITRSASAATVTPQDIESAFKRFSGPMDQAVPPSSAKKFKGKKLYELARKGIEVKIEPSRIVIHSLEIININPPEVSFRVKCSKGTYIRQLCVDIGSALGCGAYMSSLCRTGSGPFSLAGAICIDELKNMSGMELEKRLKYETNLKSKT
jgi:tRNA pseudouridine55 synthase